MARVSRAIRGQDDTPPDAAIAEIAERQHGMVARQQLVAAGIGPDAIDRRVWTGRLHPWHRGVYSVGHRAVGLRGREMGAVLACGAGAVLSHQSAAGLWGVRPPWQGTIHVTAGRARRLERVTVHRARLLDPGDCAVRDGLPTTSVGRTVLDLAEVLPQRAVERALAEAEVLRLLTRADVTALVERSNGRRGTSILRAILAYDLHAPTRSELEEHFLAFLAAHDLPLPRVNDRIHGHEVDFHWPDARLVVELDGFAYHGTREAFERDRARDSALIAEGWRVIRLTHRRLVSEAPAVARQLRRLLRPAPARGPA